MVEDPELEWLEAKYSWPLNIAEFRSADIHPSSAVKKQYMTFDSPKAKLSLGVHGGNWFQTSLQAQKSADVQIPDI